MEFILKNYKVILVVMAAILIAALIWLVLSKNGLDKIPSRGVFVIKGGFQWKIS